jgi:hypothetical protein
MTEQRHLVTQTASTSVEPRTTENVPFDASTSSVAPRRLATLFLLAVLSTAAPTGTAPAIEAYPRRRDQIVAESSTSDVECDLEVRRQIEQVFEQGASEFFQDGMYSHFSRSLMAILAQYGRAALRAIAEYVFSGSGNADVISEALRWLADFQDPATLSQRWAILERTIKDDSPRVRDGAILGFAALDDPRARKLLLESQKSEPVPELRRLIQQVVDQLNAPHAALPPQR